MKRVTILLLTALACGSSFAQQALPGAIRPLSNEVTLRLTPSFEARCTKNLHTKNPGELFGTRNQIAFTTNISATAASASRLSTAFRVDPNYLQLIYEVDGGGTRITSEPVLQTDLEWSPVEKHDFIQKHLVADKLSMAAVFGLPMRQGANVNYDVCSLQPNGTTQSKFDNYSVVGIAVIRGRESLILGGDIAATCSDRGVNPSAPGQGLKAGDWFTSENGTRMQLVSPGGYKFDVRFTGWTAIDLQSGISAHSSHAMVVSQAGAGNTTVTDDTQCLIAGAVSNPKSYAETPRERPAEQRLMELKGLFDKGLITKDQYEQKRLEIVKAL